MLFMVDHDLMDVVHSFIGTHLAGWLWDYLVVPLMLRPAWLVPAALGLIFGGMSLSLSTRRSPRTGRTGGVEGGRPVDGLSAANPPSPIPLN